jgi:regulator of protease activity HflC (stomatin/prohibitin superfamily)
MRDQDGAFWGWFWGSLIAWAVIAPLTGYLVIRPFYIVWSQQREGQAELARAEYNRRIAVLEAQAKNDSATQLAEAEVRRASGVAQANKIIGEGLKGHEEYLRYLWIQALEHVANAHGSTVIYVPTEANLPLVEAGRLGQPTKGKP